MSEMKLIIDEITDDHIKVAGVHNPTETLMKAALGVMIPFSEPVKVSADEVREKLDSAITKAAAAADCTTNGIMTFKRPVIIHKGEKMAKSAGAPAYKIYGLTELKGALDACASDGLEKLATNQFTEDLINAIHEGQEDGAGRFNVNVPVKVEFANDAVKKAFMGLGRKSKISKEKSEKIASAVKTVYKQQLIDMAIKRLTKG